MTALNEFISKIQYLIGETGDKFLCSNNQRYSSDTFQKLLELRFVLLYFYNLPEDTSEQKLEQYFDFFEARYNLNNIPYISYPSRITNILSGINVSSTDFTFSGVNEAPVNNQLHARINRQWQSFTIPNSFSQSESDNRYYPLNSNPNNYLTTETDPIFQQSAASGITSSLISQWSQAFNWGNHANAGYASISDIHPGLTLGANTNGLQLNTATQSLQLNLATTSNAGAMSVSDKQKLDSITVHPALQLGANTNGLTLNSSTQTLQLNLATTSTAGALSSSDKIKLDSLSNYTHPSGFSNQPAAQLTGNTVISRILVNSEGHVTGVNTRELNLTNIGITASPLTRVNDTNVTLTLNGTPSTALLQTVELELNWNGLLSVERGGTGSNNFTANQLLIGNGTSPVTTISRNGIDTRTTFPSSPHNLTSHTDVNITSPQQGQIIRYNGTTWINDALDLQEIGFTETDPVHTAFVQSSRTANTVYSAPNGTNGTATFRSLTPNDIPNVYVRFDTQQTLTNAQATRARNAINAQPFGNYELAFSKGNVIPQANHPLNIINGANRLVGISDLIIEHTTSDWVDKTELENKFVISNLVVDEFGHIQDWETREITLDDLGYEGFEDDINDLQNQINSIANDFSLLEQEFEQLLLNVVSDKNFVHLQASPDTVWNITHNLNKKPSITIIDSAGSQILAKIIYVDNNNVTIDFDGVGTSGEAIFN